MATKDWSVKFVQLRSTAKAKSVRRRNISAMSSPNEENSLIKDVDVRTWESARAALPPLWVDGVDEFHDHRRKIKEKMEKLQRLHTKRLMIRFDGTEVQDEAEIENATMDITQEFHRAEKVLKRLAGSGVGEYNSTKADVNIRKNVQRGLANKLQELSLEFRKYQKDYMVRVKNQKQGPEEFDFLNTNHADSFLFDEGASKDSLSQTTETQAHIHERDAEISKIAESIEELATIFKELSTLVIDQGTILDRIDYNMEEVVERTELGLQKLEKAERSHKTSRPMKCIGILLFLICFMTFILLLKHT